MNSRTDLEAELEERLEHRAAQLQVRTRPRLDAAVHRRVRARRVRTLTAGLATASLAGLMTITAVGVLRGATTAVVTTLAPAAAPAQTVASLGAAVVTTIGPSTTTAAGGTSVVGPVETVPRDAVGSTTTSVLAVPPSPVPRLALQVEGVHLERLSTQEAAAVATPDTGIQLQVYRASGSYTPPLVTVQIVPADVGFGLGQEAPAEVMEEVYVHGLTGYLVEDPALMTTSVGWRQGDGTGVYVQGVGIGGDALHEIAQNLLPDATGALRPTSLPYGLTTTPVFEGPREVRSGLYEVEYSAPAVEISVGHGGAGAFESLALDRAASAEGAEVLVVRGRPAVLFDYAFAEDDFALLWTEWDGTVVVEMRLGVPREDLPEVLDALVEVDEATWQAMADAAASTANAGADTTVAYVSEG